MHTGVMAQTKGKPAFSKDKGGSVVFKCYWDDNCNNKQDAEEPFVKGYMVTQWKAGTSKAPNDKLETIYENVPKGSHSFTIICHYAKGNMTFTFEKRELVTVQNNSTEVRIVGINQHCRQGGTGNQTNPLVLVPAPATSLPANTTKCDYFEDFSTLYNWTAFGKGINFTIANQQLQATIPGAYTDVRLLKKIEQPIHKATTVSVDMMVTNHSDAGVAFLPVVFTDSTLAPSNPNNSPKVQTNQNAFGILLGSDHYFTPVAEMYITPYQKNGATAILQTEASNRITIEKNKWYRIVLQTTSDSTATLQAFSADTKQWSRKVPFKIAIPLQQLAYLQIANMVQADKNRNVSVLMDNICIQRAGNKL